ncbi:hypothetical protein AB685_17655 [Bacillus sp. LL01]|uniref:hypothetical protein n=1 Tax=Bacillus sp. LL01 TaxID=1665556 RepID=UPI00064D0523|nr:hypothetical protein [Bacillus sp. LL01]KMJ57228.1 hypothetical protein AB685_17655 [Bacillus sp. LL01]
MQKSSTKFGSLFFLLSVIPLVSLMSSWGAIIVEFFNRVTIFIPLACGIIGLVVSLFGDRGWPKIVLVLGNILCIGAWILLLFVAIYGFLAP